MVMLIVTHNVTISWKESWLRFIYGFQLIFPLLCFASRNLVVNYNSLPVNHYKQINRFYETNIMAISIIPNGRNTALNTNVEL